LPIDISLDALLASAAELREAYPRLAVAPLAGDFTQHLQLPPEARGRPHTGFFPGSTIGNFEHEDAVVFLRSAGRLLGEGAYMLVGADLVKDEAVLVAAYDDAQGVTAAFNKNLLARINRELDGDFDLDGFRHEARWNTERSRIEMHLVSLLRQTAQAGGESFHFSEGESIHTENSHKFTVEGFAALAARAGWRQDRVWTDPQRLFSVMLLKS
jgi:dimethylhistidine N-methyltransferase